MRQGGAVARHVCDSHCGHIGQVAPTHDLDELLSRSIAADITPGDTGWTVRRHSSWEHMLIGDLDPQQLATIGAPVFKVHGDDSMFKKDSSKGLMHSGENAHWSRNSIMATIATGSPDHSTADIVERFPERVKVGKSKTLGLAEWHEGPLRSLATTDLFPAHERLRQGADVEQDRSRLAGGLGKITKDAAPHAPTCSDPPNRRRHTTGSTLAP